MGIRDLAFLLFFLDLVGLSSFLGCDGGDGGCACFAVFCCCTFCPPLLVFTAVCGGEGAGVGGGGGVDGFGVETVAVFVLL